MAIFARLENEGIVQVGDQTRLNASRSSVSTDESAITLIEVQPEDGDAWYDVTLDGFLDWQYTTDGLKVASVRVTTTGQPTSASESLEVISAADDKLFSQDSDLLPWEPDIRSYIRQGRSTFKDVHRESQRQILDWLDAQGIRSTTGNRLSASAVVDTQEVKEWSKFLTLQIIFEGLANAVDDIFSRKAAKYEAKAIQARNRSEIRLDLNGDGVIDESEKKHISSIGVGRV